MAMEIRFERDALYNEVWETPMRTLSARYGLSDNGLRDICRTLAIPFPPRGHWAKKAAGHSVIVPPLQPTTGSTSYVFRYTEKKTLLPPNDEHLAWLTERLAFESDSANHIVVADELIQPHSLVRQTAKALEEYRRKLESSRKRFEEPPKRTAKWQPDFSAFSKPSWRDYLSKGYIEMHGEVLPLRVSLQTADRALRLWDTLIKACVSRKIKVSLGSNRLLVEERGVTLELRLSERLEQVTLSTKGMADIDVMFKRHIRYDSTGDLRIFVSGFGTEWKLSDDRKGKLEERLNMVFSRIHSEVKHRLDWNDEDVERRRLRAIAEHERELAQQREAERIQRVKEEQGRVVALAAEAESWRHADAIRKYVTAVQERARNMTLSLTENSNLDAWSSWACQAADVIDPIERRLEQFRADQK